MKNKITDKLKDRKHRCTKIAQSLMSGLLFFLCICLSGCERRQEEEIGLTPLETDEMMVSDAVEDGGGLTVPGAMEDSRSQTAADVDGNGADMVSDGRNTQQATVCFVHIYGAVVNPGVYELQEGSRIFHAVSEAGGFTEEACQDYVNQARQVSDGMKIWIPTEEEASELLASSGDGKGGAGSSDGNSTGVAAVSGPYGDGAGIEISDGQAADTDGSGACKADGTLVNINTATVEQLCTLSGIGESRAKTIIAYREAHGAFAKKEDIMKVTGIKESSYGKIKDQITVGKE